MSVCETNTWHGYQIILLRKISLSKDDDIAGNNKYE
jgi:hypothetical protein